MIGVCIPAHNEEELIGACLASIFTAAHDHRLEGEAVIVVVVLDDCSDGTAAIVSQWPCETVVINAKNVGTARDTGARLLLQRQARWIAFTDADSCVAPDWLFMQLGLGAEVVCGTVEVDSWEGHGTNANAARCRFESSYQDREGHRHVHGANLGISAMSYKLSGGFEALVCGEDQALVDRLAELGCQIAWTALPRVRTSGRPFSRIENGFAGAIRLAF